MNTARPGAAAISCPLTWKGPGQPHVRGAPLPGHAGPHISVDRIGIAHGLDRIGRDVQLELGKCSSSRLRNSVSNWYFVARQR